MKNSELQPSNVSKNIETYIKTAIVFLIIYLSFLIFKPFLLPVVWGAILAIALYPLHNKFSKLLRGRSKLSAVIITLIFLLIIIIPAKSFVESLVRTSKELMEHFNTGTLSVQAPPDKVAQWPVIGERLYNAWDTLAQNFESGLEMYRDQFKDIILWLYRTLMGITGTILIFVIAFILSGVFLNLSSKSGYTGLYNIGEKLLGDKGETMISNTVKTVRSVMTGILGTAIIQSLILSTAFFVFNVPGAPLLSIIVLIMAIAQLPVILLALPVLIYMLSVLSGFNGVVFTIWIIVGALSDNFLKPMLLGRGLKIPMLVILIGAIGGMLLMGIIGLFLGAVILSVAYQILQIWIGYTTDEEVAKQES